MASPMGRSEQISARLNSPGPRPKLPVNIQVRPDVSVKNPTWLGTERPSRGPGSRTTPNGCTCKRPDRTCRASERITPRRSEESQRAFRRQLSKRIPKQLPREAELAGQPGLSSARQRKIDRSLARHKDMAIVSMPGDMGAPPEGSSKAWHSAREGRWLTGGPQSSRAHASSEGGRFAGPHAPPHAIVTKLSASFLKAVLAPFAREVVHGAPPRSSDRVVALSFASGTVAGGFLAGRDVIESMGVFRSVRR